MRSIWQWRTIPRTVQPARNSSSLVKETHQTKRMESQGSMEEGRSKCVKMLSIIGTLCVSTACALIVTRWRMFRRVVLQERGQVILDPGLGRERDSRMGPPGVQNEILNHSCCCCWRQGSDTLTLVKKGAIVTLGPLSRRKDPNLGTRFGRRDSSFPKGDFVVHCIPYVSSAWEKLEYQRSHTHGAPMYLS